MTMQRNGWIIVAVFAALVLGVIAWGLASGAFDPLPTTCDGIRAEQRDLTTNPSGMTSDDEARYRRLADRAQQMGCE